MINLRWNPPGTMSLSFMQELHDIMALMGPVGSGKTSTCVMKLSKLASMQEPSPIDGVRYTKWAVIRDTYRNLNRTTVKTFKTWFPQGAGVWTGGANEPAVFHLRGNLPDGTVLDLLVEFIALGDNAIEDVARGWEGTGVWLNEADLLPPDVLSYMYGRTGRYPSKLHGGATWNGVIMDYNAPDTENYCYRLFEEMRPDGYKLYRQPGGREQGAENLSNLPPGYYDGQIAIYMAQGREDLVRRMVDNRYGYSRDGKPVYAEYRDDFHCAGSDIAPVQGLPIVIHADQGLRPGVVLTQLMPSGQLRILDELYCDTGAKGMAVLVLRLMAERYSGFKLVGGLADPAAGARDANEAESWLDAFNRHLGLRGADRIRIAPSNRPDICTSAVRVHLNGLVDNGQPRLLLSRRCKIARKGFNSAYCYKKIVGAHGMFTDKPVKLFPVSDVMNAIEFACQSDGGYQEVVGREFRKRGAGSAMRTAPLKVKL